LSEDRWRAFQQPGLWLWLALALGAALRVYFVFFTEGSFDVSIKLHHGSRIRELGLLEYYRRAEVMNHPPLAGGYFAACAWLAEKTGVAFGAWLRLPFALLDGATAALVMRAFAATPWRLAAFAACWANPLAALFSSYHGNTDSTVAFFVLLSLLAAARGRGLAAGALLGLGLWWKLPVLVAAPALCLGLPGSRERVRFVLGAGAVGLLVFLPWLAQEPALVVERIAGYGGSPVVTPRGIAIWGLGHVLRLPGAGIAALEAANPLLVWTPILALAWLRRASGPAKLPARELGATVCASFLLLYGVSSFWAWQYLAWSIPLWLFLGWRFTAAATLVISAYVYGVYALFTGSAVLQGRWDFVRHGPWPPVLTLLRDASVLLCLAAGVFVLVRAVRAARRRPAVPA
jgi:hypothetical protein